MAIKSRLKSLLFDDFTVANETPAVPMVTRAIRTFRYRCAGRGVPLCFNERRLVRLKDKYKNERCFIMGNGPSLIKCDLYKLKKEYTFGVNNIFLAYDKMGFHPTFYVVEDVYVAEDRATEINAYSGPKYKFFGNYLEHCLRDTEDAVWLNIRFRYDEYPGFPHFSENSARELWTGGTVSYICMQLAFYMGFKEIYLIGFDHSYRVPQGAMVEGKKITSTDSDPNHFHPGYFGKGYRWHDPMVDRMEVAYEKAKYIFQKRGRKISNATVGGNLEVFPRVEFNALFYYRD